MTHPVLLRPECVEAGGDVVVGLLLSQIVYWYLPDKEGKPKLRIHRHGLYWVMKTREDWMEETGLTLEQYKRAVAVLKRKGLVETRVMRRFNGDAVTHLRLLQPIAGATLPLPPRWLKPPTGWSQTPHADGGKATTQVQIVQKTEKTEEEKEKILISIGETQSSFASNLGSSVKGSNSEGNQEQGQEQGKSSTKAITPNLSIAVQKHPWWAMNAKEVLKAHQASLNGELGAYWQSRVKLVTENPKAYLPPLTLKQRGQLSHLKKKLGEMTRPVIAYAVEHWMKFASEAADYAGWSDYPTNPDIGFLLKHHHVAVNLLMPKAPKPKATPAVEAVQSVAPVAKKEPVHVLTLKELTELLDEYHSS
jgi:hypothetical protein